MWAAAAMMTIILSIASTTLPNVQVACLLLGLLLFTGSIHCYTLIGVAPEVLADAVVIVTVS